MKLKVFAVQNGNSDSDFNLKDNMVSGGSNSHSGGAVVIAENKEEAKKLIMKQIKLSNSYDWEDGTAGTVKEVTVDDKGVILFADGDC